MIKSSQRYDFGKLKVIGKGTQGIVYKIDSERCIKIFKSAVACKGEVEALQLAQKNRHFPKLFEFGDKYIIREYVKGIPLDKYLEKEPLTLEWSIKIVDLYDALKEVGFHRLDTVLFHIYVTKGGLLKMIDPAKSLKLSIVYPKRLLKGLWKLGYQKIFLNHVKAVRPELYRLWMVEKK